MTKPKNNRQTAMRWAIFFYTLYVSLIPLNMVGIPYSEFFMYISFPLLSLTPSTFHLGRPGTLHNVYISDDIIALMFFLIILQIIIARLHFKNSERLRKGERPRLLPYSLSYAHYLITFVVTVGEPGFNDTIKSIIFFGTVTALVLVSLGLTVTKKVIDCDQSNKDSSEDNT